MCRSVHLYAGTPPSFQLVVFFCLLCSIYCCCCCCRIMSVSHGISSSQAFYDTMLHPGYSSSRTASLCGPLLCLCWHCISCPCVMCVLRTIRKHVACATAAAVMFEVNNTVKIRVNAPPGRCDFAGNKICPGAFTAWPVRFLKERFGTFCPPRGDTKKQEKKTRTHTQHTPLTHTATALANA